MAALSYKWLGICEPDPNRFHLDAILQFFAHPRKQTALMWDFAAVCQRDPALFDPKETPMEQPEKEQAAFMAAMALDQDDPMRKYLGGKAYDESRTADETALFKAGLKVMSNVYASPRVLVLQQKQTPKKLIDERRSYGGQLPEIRLDLIPYAGRDLRSGWCTFESASAMLMTEGGGHAYEWTETEWCTMPVTRGYLPSKRVMRDLFLHQSTRFVGKGDKELVFNIYAELRDKLNEYDEQRKPWLVRYFDRVWTEEDKCCARFCALFILPLLTIAAVVVFYFILTRATAVRIASISWRCMRCRASSLRSSSSSRAASCARTSPCSSAAAPATASSTNSAARSGSRPTTSHRRRKTDMRRRVICSGP